MRTNNLFTRVASLVAIVSTGISFSCQETEVPLAQETSYVVEESVTDVYFDDADDLAGVTIATDTRTTNGRMSSALNNPIDDRLCAGATVTFSFTQTDPYPIGDIVIDFGTTGCTDDRGNTRTGKIKIHFVNYRFVEGSTMQLTFENYTINDIKLEGTRTLTNLTGSSEGTPKFQVQLVGGKATWPDGTDATREHCFERQWDRGNPDILTDDLLTLDQCAGEAVAAAGTNRRGVAYTMTIVEPLVFDRSCEYRMPVQGIKKFVEVATGKEIIIDYGDGECDRMITITVNGNSRTVEAKGK